MWVAVALCAIIFWLAIFFTFFQANEEALRVRLPKRDGKLPELDVWTRSGERDDGRFEEERFVQQGRKLWRQVRLKSPGGDVLEVLMNEKVR